MNEIKYDISKLTTIIEFKIVKFNSKHLVGGLGIFIVRIKHLTGNKGKFFSLLSVVLDFQDVFELNLKQEEVLS